MESDPVGHAVAFITANDPDGDMLWYKIEGLFAEFLFFAFSKFPSQLSSFFFIWFSSSNSFTFPRIARVVCYSSEIIHLIFYLILFFDGQMEISATNLQCKRQAMAKFTWLSLSIGNSNRLICSTLASRTATTRFTLRFPFLVTRSSYSHLLARGRLGNWIFSLYWNRWCSWKLPSSMSTITRPFSPNSITELKCLRMPKWARKLSRSMPPTLTKTKESFTPCTQLPALPHYASSKWILSAALSLWLRNSTGKDNKKTSLNTINLC